jgi:DNA-binding NtrC family response regulator
MVAFLLVDGDRNFRDALAIGLRLDGHLAMTTGDVEEACERLRAVRLDCCLVDAHLPGADALLEIAAGAGLLAIATSPHPDLLAAAASRHPRAEAMAKPFQSIDLLSRFRMLAAADAGPCATPVPR